MLCGRFFLGTTVLRLKGKGQVSRSQEGTRDILPSGYSKGFINQMGSRRIKNKRKLEMLYDQFKTNNKSKVLLM